MKEDMLVKMLGRWKLCLLSTIYLVIKDDLFVLNLFLGRLSLFYVSDSQEKNFLAQFVYATSENTSISKAVVLSTTGFGWKVLRFSPR